MKNHNIRPGGRGVTLPRAMSKLGYCSRTQAETLINEGRVKINGRSTKDCQLWVDLDLDELAVDGETVGKAANCYVMLNKPRGLVTTRKDPGGRDTVFSCLRTLDVPHISPVGRLDKASEGLLLFTNDTTLAQRLLDPETNVRKIYHVQVSGKPSDLDVKRMTSGIQDRGELLTASSARIARLGVKNVWLEIELREGRNRQIRRMVEALGLDCLRLVRIEFGNLTLGSLGKAESRFLAPSEIETLGRTVLLR